MAIKEAGGHERRDGKSSGEICRSPAPDQGPGKGNVKGKAKDRGDGGAPPQPLPPKQEGTGRWNPNLKPTEARSAPINCGRGAVRPTQNLQLDQQTVCRSCQNPVVRPSGTPSLCTSRSERGRSHAQVVTGGPAGPSAIPIRSGLASSNYF